MTARLLSFPLVAVIVAAGVWVAGGLITNDFRTSAALITGWMLAPAIACVAVAVRWRALRVPVIAGFIVSAGAISGFLALSTLRDRVVHEHVFVGRRAAAVATGAPVPRGPVELARGRLRSGEHRTVGVAAVVRLGDDGTVADCRVGVTGAGPKAQRATATESALKGQQPSAETIRAAAEQAASGLELMSDLSASEEFRAHLVRVHARRALVRAIAST
jgi:hypothetical protein